MKITNIYLQYTKNSKTQAYRFVRDSGLSGYLCLIRPTLKSIYAILHHIHANKITITENKAWKLYQSI